MGEGTDVKTWTREELRLGERIRGAAEVCCCFLVYHDFREERRDIDAS